MAKVVMFSTTTCSWCHRFFNNFDRFDDGNNFEFDDVRSTPDVGGTTTTTCDQEVNQAAAAG